MASTNYIDGTTVIVASWLNDVNVATYTTLPALAANLAANYAPLVSPVFVTPSLGVATATSINGVTINTGVLSGTNTGDQSIFQTIAVSGQSNVVADSTTDTLTLAAGSGISITTNAATDTVTITNTNTAVPGLVLLSTTNVTTVTNLDFLNVFSSTYDRYLIDVSGVICTGTSGQLNGVFANAGVVDTAANYCNPSPLTSFQISNGGVFVGGLGVSASISLTNANGTATVKNARAESAAQVGTTTFNALGLPFCYIKTSAVSGFRLFWSGGQSFAAQGIVRIYAYTN